MNYDLFNQPAETFWTNSVHKTERSPYGQTFLDKSRKKFGGQCRMVFDCLMNGGEVDGDMVAEWTPKIKFLNSRISDLRNEMKLHISQRPHPTKDVTIYFMSEEDRAYNKILIDKLQQLQ